MFPRRDSHPGDPVSCWWISRFLGRLLSNPWSLALCSPTPQAAHAWWWGSWVQARLPLTSPVVTCSAGAFLGLLCDQSSVIGFLASKHLFLLSNPAVLYVLVALWFPTKQNTSLTRIPVARIPGSGHYSRMAFADWGAEFQRHSVAKELEVVGLGVDSPTGSVPQRL